MNATTTQEAQTLELVEAETDDRRLPAVQQGGALAANSPAAMMLQALGAGASLEQIEKMMDLQERFEKREAEKACNDDFAAFRGENVIIPRTKHVNRGKAGSFMQAEYDEVARRLSPALSKHGFAFNHEVSFAMRNLAEPGQEPINVGWVTVKCTLTHRLGHARVEVLEGPQDDQSANSPVQNMQSTATFLKRQSLLNITGTATGGEDDESRQRGRAGSDDAPSDEENRDLEAGENAADRGIKALTDWWGKLNNKQRSALNSEFGRLRKIAQAVDQGAGRA